MGNRWEDGLDITITNKNVEQDQEIREYITEKFEKVEQKYLVKITDGTVVLEQKKYLFCVDIRVQAKNLTIYGEDTAEKNVYAAIEGAFGKIDIQLKKHKERVKNRKSDGLPEEEIEATEDYNESEDEQ